MLIQLNFRSIIMTFIISTLPFQCPCHTVHCLCQRRRHKMVRSVCHPEPLHPCCLLNRIKTQQAWKRTNNATVNTCYGLSALKNVVNSSLHVVPFQQSTHVSMLFSLFLSMRIWVFSKIQSQTVANHTISLLKEKKNKKPD